MILPDKAKRWDGADFTIPYNGIGKPVASITDSSGKRAGDRPLLLKEDFTGDHQSAGILI